MVVLDRKYSNHCPILLKDMERDFSPKPFRIFDFWLEEPDFKEDVKNFWTKRMASLELDKVFRDKLKLVKEDLKVWYKMKFRNLDLDMRNFKSKACSLDLEAKKRGLSNAELEEWKMARSKWVDLERKRSTILREKSRSKWILEGDENSKLFHASVKRNRHKNNIFGIVVDVV